MQSDNGLLDCAATLHALSGREREYSMARVVRDQSISAQDAVRRHPTLKGMYTNISSQSEICVGERPVHST